MHLHPVFVYLFELLVLVGGAIFVYSLFKKTRVDGNCQIAAHSGDAETMTFNLNLSSRLSHEEKQEKVNEAFQLIQTRRDWIHEQMQEIRRKSQEEAQNRAADRAGNLQSVPTKEGKT